jgi:peptidyl-dipeptidase Dcp
MPPAMIDAIEQGLRYDRVFSLGLDFLGCAILDMRLHMAADGSEIDAAGLERETYAELGMPAAIDPLLPLASSFHVFAGPYPAGLYVYLWGEIMAADAAEAFLESPGGFYDETAAALWERAVLGAGATAPAEQAFRTFRGRDPDPDALLRRFGLLAAPAA